MMNADASLADFVLYLSAEKGLSPRTLIEYQRDIRSLIKYLEATFQITSFAEVTHDHLVDYLAHLKAKKYATGSLKRYLMAFKVLFKYLKREKYVNTNVALYLESPKRWQVLPDVLTLEEIDLLISQPDDSEFKGSRDRAMMEVLYGSGLRVSELCSLNILDVSDGFVKVFGKGRKERVVPIGIKAVDAVDGYSCFRDYYAGEEQALFITKKGKRMRRAQVWYTLKVYAKQAGITKNIFPHTLRHTFATHLLDNRADIRVIQEMMGHAKISSTDRYMHVSGAQIREAFDKYTPVSSKQ